MRAMFDQVMYDPATPVGSHWEASAGDPVAGCDPVAGDLDCDVAIIGGGFTGLSAALHLVRDGLSVRVIEAVAPGWGASGRNGGHCCFGGAGLDAPTIAEQFGEEVARHNIATQREAIELVRDLAEGNSLDIDIQGQGALGVAHTRKAAAELVDTAAMWKRLGGFDCELLSTEAFRERGYTGPHVHGGLVFPYGFGVHPMKYARELARLAQREGAVIHGSSPVTGWRRENGRHRLLTASGSVSAAKVLIATNGFTRDDLHPALAGCLLPGISEIVATRPLTEDELAAHSWKAQMPLYDTRPMFAYFRILPDRRLHMGGCRRHDRHARVAGALAILPGQAHPHHVPGVAPRGDRTTAGAASSAPPADRLTHVGEIPDDPGVFYSLAYHGNGVAMATWSGRAVAGLISGKGNRTLPATMTRPLPRFPIPALRKMRIYRRYGWRFLKMKLGG